MEMQRAWADLLSNARTTAFLTQIKLIFGFRIIGEKNTILVRH